MTEAERRAFLMEQARQILAEDARAAARHPYQKPAVERIGQIGCYTTLAGAAPPCWSWL
jgi:hypothetical protein